MEKHYFKKNQIARSKFKRANSRLETLTKKNEGEKLEIIARVHIDDPVWHLDVGSSHPGAGAGPKGLAVRQLKRYASWVQNVVRQFGPYPLWAQET